MKANIFQFYLVDSDEKLAKQVSEYIPFNSIQQIRNRLFSWPRRAVAFQFYLVDSAQKCSQLRKNTSTFNSIYQIRLQLGQQPLLLNAFNSIQQIQPSSACNLFVILVTFNSIQQIPREIAENKGATPCFQFYLVDSLCIRGDQAWQKKLSILSSRFSDKR